MIVDGGDWAAIMIGSIGGSLLTLYVVAPIVGHWLARRRAPIGPPRHAARDTPIAGQSYADPLAPTELAGWQRVKLARLADPARQPGDVGLLAHPAKNAAIYLADVLRRDMGRLTDLELAGVLLQVHDVGESIRDGWMGDIPAATAFHDAIGLAAVDLTTLHRTDTLPT